VRGLSLVSLLNDFSSEMVYPLLPAFVTRVLGGGAVTLGALDGAADLTAAALRWVSGKLADRPGWSRRLIVGGYGLAVLVRPLVAITSAAWQVIGLRVLDRLGKGLRSPARDALIAKLTPPEALGRAFGFNRSADHLGAVAGSLAAWVLLTGQTDVRGVIIASAVPGVLALAVLWRVFRRIDPQVVLSVPETAEPAAASDRQDRAFWVPVLALTLLTVARLPETLLLLRLQDLGLAVATVPLAWAGLHIVRTLAAYPGGWLSDRIGPRFTLAAAGLVFGAVLFLLSRDLTAMAAGMVFLVLGLVAGLAEGGERAVVAWLAPRRTGRAFGSAQALAGVAALPAGVAFGLLYQSRGGAAALLASAAVTTVAAVTWLMVAPMPKHRTV
jgi:MFS family permease